MSDDWSIEMEVKAPDYKQYNNGYVAIRCPKCGTEQKILHIISRGTCDGCGSQLRLTISANPNP